MRCERDTDLFSIAKCLSCRVLIRLRIIHLQSGKGWVFEPNVQADNMMNDRLVLVGFQWRRYRQIRSSVTVQNVHQFRLFDGRYHNAPSFRIGGEVLTRNDTPCSGFSIRLFMKFDKTCGLDIVI